jgi:nucleoside-diphosphate-sugar epimerase
MSRFTVLGASGTIGGRLVSHLRSGGHEVYAPSRGDDEAFRRPLGHAIYAIGITADFRTRPLDTIEAHVSILHELLKNAEFDSLLYLSSTRVYSGLPTGEKADESARLLVDPNSPSDLYNLSKLMGESLCLHSGRTNARIARLSNVIGGDDITSANFLPSLMREARTGKITLRSALHSAKDYIHIDDVVALLGRIALHGRDRLYNVASGFQIRHGEWAEAIAARSGATLNVLPDAPVLGFPPIEIRRIVTEFNITPQHPLRAFMNAWPDEGNGNEQLKIKRSV